MENGWPECVCNIGVQECPIHPGKLLTKEQKIKFAKDWDRRVVPSNPEQMRGRPGS